MVMEDARAEMERLIQLGELQNDPIRTAALQEFARDRYVDCEATAARPLPFLLSQPAV
jgi:hypothetical protein